MKRILTCTQKIFEQSENYVLRCVLREAHLREMATVPVKAGINIIFSKIGNDIKGWFPKEALLALKKEGIGTDKTVGKFAPTDDNGSTIPWHTWAVLILTGLVKKVKKSVILELQRFFPEVFPEVGQIQQSELPLDEK